MSINVKCVNSYCSDAAGGKSISWKRYDDNCIGKNNCGDTCQCVTPYAAGLESYIDDGTSTVLFDILIIGVSMVLFFLIVGLLHSKRCVQCKEGRCKQRDDYSFGACLGYLFQLWDFFSDVFLCYDIWDHWYQESFDSPDKDTYFTFFILSVIFILVPWSINLIFLLNAKKHWESKAIAMSRNQNENAENIESTSALQQSEIHTSKWVNKYANLLTLLCMLSGGLTASLKLVNSKLFGMEPFNMGLPKYKQDKASRHRLWLTVVLENLPQIFISTLYASLLLGEFGNIVLLALVSSCASVILALISIQLEFPKKYFIYEIKCILLGKHYKLRRKLRQTKSLSLAICEGLDQDFGYVFVENAFIVNNSQGIIMNIMCNENIDLRMVDDSVKKQIILSLKSRSKIICQNIGLSFIKYECIELVTCKQMCNKMRGRRGSVRRRQTHGNNNNNNIISNNNRKQIELHNMESENTDGLALSLDALNAMNTLNNKYKSTEFDSNNLSPMAVMTQSNSQRGIDDFIGYTHFSYVGSNSQINVMNNTNNGNGMDYSWNKWTCDDVCNWFTLYLKNNKNSNNNGNSGIATEKECINDENVNSFIKLLKKHCVNGHFLKHMMQDEYEFARAANVLSSQSECMSMWLLFKQAILLLKQNPQMADSYNYNNINKDVNDINMASGIASSENEKMEGKDDNETAQTAQMTVNGQAVDIAIVSDDDDDA